MKYLLLALLFFTSIVLVQAQEVDIISYGTNPIGQVQLRIDGSADKYYTLSTVHEPDGEYEIVTSITLGQDGPMSISEPLSAYPEGSYTITAHDLANPSDTDGDGRDDITELNNMPEQSPLNYARVIPFVDGVGAINSRDEFAALAVVDTEVSWAPFLDNQEFVKFAIVNQSSAEPEVYYINSQTHFIHANFLSTIGVDQFGDDVTTGEIVYNPNTISPNGVIGSYTFNYSFGNAMPFDVTQQTFELLARSMPYLNNNMQHFIGSGGESLHISQYRDDFEGSRIGVVLESEVFEDVGFLPFNQAEGFGFFRRMTLEENPSARDIVLYDALPNSLPRVGGIITSVIQTPLSHVNLRAIQDNVPNAYIQDPLSIDSIANLLDNYIYYKVTADSYEIREATLEEVNQWFEKLRPTEEQIPERDLSFTDIMPLDSIEFSMSTAFGAKCSNVATMRKFGFPDGTIPNGFGVPFYYYDEFMKYNGFYDKVADMISQPDFIADLEVRIDRLDDFRKEIRDGDMPQWMLDALEDMHDSFPEGTSVRCRSSTNNEDLPGFSGAGLYTSKTQHPEEGHIKKSIKQVYASMWNFRAFEERDFYRVDHYIAAMGVLCHPNFEEEKSNGVGVSIDPIYLTDNTFYLNTQVGEFLITNPDANSIPEEILLSEDPAGGYVVLRNSNLVNDDELVMGEQYLDQMRSYLRTIHDEFAVLYGVVGAEGFGMDIEYKVTAEDQLIIKQARPWVSFWADIKAEYDLSVTELVEPVSSASLGDSETVTVTVANQGLKPMTDFDVSLLVNDQLVETITVLDTLAQQTETQYTFATLQDLSVIGDYTVTTIVSQEIDGYESNDTLHTIVSKLHELEAGLAIASIIAECGDELQVTAQVTNYGDATLTDTEIQVTANGVVVDVVDYDRNIVYGATANVSIMITEELQPTGNVIELSILSVNDQADAVSDNNTASELADLNDEFEFVTLIINVDNYPQETSWEILEQDTDEVVVAGSLDFNSGDVEEEICLRKSSCYVLKVYDSVGDGICCAFGVGDFFMVNSDGEVLLEDNGDFGSLAVHEFCPRDICELAATVATTPVSVTSASDGVIDILQVSGGVAPYQYSINGGATFVSNSSFSDLPAGSYQVFVIDAEGECTYSETVEITIDSTSSTGEIEESAITIYPNPTSGVLTVKLSTIGLHQPLRVDTYNTMGQLVATTSVHAGESEAVLSLQDYASGSYIVKCFNDTYDQYFRVVRL